MKQTAIIPLFWKKVALEKYSLFSSLTCNQKSGKPVSYLKMSLPYNPQHTSLSFGAEFSK